MPVKLGIAAGEERLGASGDALGRRRYYGRLLHFDGSPGGPVRIEVYSLTAVLNIVLRQLLGGAGSSDRRALRFADAGSPGIK